MSGFFLIFIVLLAAGFIAALLIIWQKCRNKTGDQSETERKAQKEALNDKLERLFTSLVDAGFTPLKWTQSPDRGEPFIVGWFRDSDNTLYTFRMESKGGLTIEKV